MTDPDSLARLLVVRHGQSTWNAEGRWQGTEDPPLSTLGVRQARAAAAVLGSFDAVAASHLARARTTAEIIAGELGIGPVRVEPDLRERYAGDYQGLTHAEIDERFPGQREQRIPPPGWEDDDAVVGRATTVLAQIAVAVGGGTALVVSHGGVIRNLEELLGVRREGTLANLGGRWLHVGPGVLKAGEAVDLIADDLRTVPGQP